MSALDVLRGRVVPVVWSLVLAAIVIGPSASSTHLVGHPTLDVWAHAWGADWFAQKVGSLEAPWHVEGAAHGADRVLWYIDPIGAVVGGPLRALMGPIMGWNLQLAVQVAVAGLGGWMWGRALGGRGWVASAALATAPFLQGELWNGVSESCWVGLVAIAGALAARRSWTCGIAVGLAAVATPYLAVSAGLLTATVILMGGSPAAVRDLGLPEMKMLSRLRLGVLAAGVAVLIALPHLWFLTESLASTEGFVMRPLSHGGFNPAVLRSNATDPLALVHPGDFWSVPFSGDMWSVAWRRTPYLGLSLLAFALPAVVRRERRKLGWLWVPAVVGVVACLGPFLWHAEGWVETSAGGHFRLPMWWVSEASPVAFDHPMRFVVLAVVVLSGLADASVARFGWLVVPLVVAEHLWLAPTSWPIAVSDAALPAVYGSLPDDGLGVVDLPAEAGTGNRTNAYLFWQRLHERPVPYGNKVGAMGVPLPNAAVRSWAALSKRGGGYIEGVEPGADLAGAARDLVAAGYGWVVLHPTMLVLDNDSQKHIAAISDVLGSPSEQEGALVWSLRGVEQR